MRSWSVSSIRTFHECQLKWWLRREGAPEDFKPLALVEGIVLHEVVAEHLRRIRDGDELTEADAVALLRATFFSQEAGVPIRYGEKSRDDVLARLEALFRHWRANFRPGGSVVAVEREIRAELPGIDLPLLAYVDLVVRSGAGDVVADFKVTASRPTGDPLLDPLDLQKLALTRAWEAVSGRAVVGWTWVHLVKTKAPALIDIDLEVTARHRADDLRRLAAVVNPTLRLMQAVLDGKLAPVPTQAASAFCSSCPWRSPCAARFVGASRSSVAAGRAR